MPKPSNPHAPYCSSCDRRMAINQRRKGKVTQWRCYACGSTRSASGRTKPGPLATEKPVEDDQGTQEVA